jgi:hypothetical protein
VSSLVQEEGGLAYCLMNGVIVCELGEQEPVCPIVLLVIDKGPQVLFDLSVDPLSLPIGLGVVCGAWVPFYSQVFVKPTHKPAHKLRSSVADYLQW